MQGNGTKTVLLVEDDEDVREAVEEILTGEGFHVIAAPDGGVALQVLAEGRHRFCTVILDVLMPGVDGRSSSPGPASSCARFRSCSSPRATCRDTSATTRR